MFQNYQPNIENLKDYMNKNNENSGGSGIQWWSIPSGMSSVRILPPWDPTGRISLPVYMHPIEYKAEGSQYTKYNWTCVNKTFNKPCAICEGIAGLSSSGVDVSNWEANRRQFYFNAIVMHDPTYNAAKNTGVTPGTHVLMKAPKTFYDWVVAQITNPMIGDISNITNGIDVLITKEGQGLGTTYTMTLSPNGRTPIPQEYLDKIKDLYNLDDVFSTGFEQSQVDELVNHLRKSAGVMSSGVGNAVSQMAGYNPNHAMAQYQQYAQAQTSHSMTMNQVPTMGQVPQMPQIPPMNQAPVMPPQSSYTAPQVPVAPPQPSPVQQPVQAPSTSNQGNQPKCFGQYDPGSVNCVVCPVELDCQKMRG